MLMPNELLDTDKSVAAVQVGNALIGYDPAITGPGAVPCPGFVPTRHELEVLARHWLEIDLGLKADFETTGQSGSTEWRRQVYANQRLALLEQTLGSEELDRIIDEVGEVSRRRTTAQ